MSFIITIYTNEGIVMASDSRSTTSTTQFLPNGTIANSLGTQITDTTYKTFLYDNRIGISTCGAATINGKPITGYIERFLMENEAKKYTVHAVSEALLTHFSSLSPADDIHFFVAGYGDSDTPIVEQVVTKGAIINSANVQIKGAVWDGEMGIFARLVNPVIVNNMNGTYYDLPAYVTNYEFFTLQDAVEFAEYAIDVTIKTMKFQNCVKTVGGPISGSYSRPNSGGIQAGILSNIAPLKQRRSPQP